MDGWWVKMGNKISSRPQADKGGDKIIGYHGGTHNGQGTACRDKKPNCRGQY